MLSSRLYFTNSLDFKLRYQLLNTVNCIITYEEVYFVYFIFVLTLYPRGKPFVLWDRKYLGHYDHISTFMQTDTFIPNISNRYIFSLIKIVS